MTLTEAMRHIDLSFGDGYAIDNPTIVVEYLKAEAISNIKFQIEAGTIELSKNIANLTKIVAELTQKLPHID